MPEPDSDDEYEDSFSKKRGGGGRGGRKSGGPGSRGVCFYFMNTVYRGYFK